MFLLVKVSVTQAIWANGALGVHFDGIFDIDAKPLVV
jgi:hypothetical protein